MHQKSAMNRIVWGFAGLTTAAWLFGLWADPPAMNGREVVHEVFYWNGVLAWGLMAMAIVIAARPTWLERVTRTPLDALYRWHRTLGFWALGLSAFHWLTKTAVRPFLSFLTLEPVNKIVPAADLSGFDLFWSQLRAFSTTSSIWATAIAFVLGVLVFVKPLRYSKWLTLHKLFSVLFIVLSVHAIRLMDPADALMPLGIINIAATLIGLWYSIVLLVRGAGSEKTVAGRITAAETAGDLTLLSVMPEKPVAIKAGQFAFLSVPGEEKHPFSVAQALPTGELRFAVKSLGDFTTSAVPKLAVGDAVRIEGPWGAFTPDLSGSSSELWVAGGVGIAPFCAWLQAAAHKAENAKSALPKPNASLLWCIRDAAAEPLLPQVKRLAERAGIRLEVVESKKKRLDAGRLFAERVPDSLALCAGAGLSQAVEKAFLEAGGAKSSIRREHFEWRA